MIFTSVCGLGGWLINFIFNGFTVLGVPVSALSYLFNFIEVGVWVVGPLCLSAVFTSVAFWFGFRLAAGLALFVWRLLPLT